MHVYIVIRNASDPASGPRNQALDPAISGFKNVESMQSRGNLID